MPIPRRSRSFLFAAITLLLAGCAAPLDPTARSSAPSTNGGEDVAQGAVLPPESIPRRDLYPMAVGNRWVYDRTDHTQVIPYVGPQPPPDIRETTFEVTHACAINYDGLDYIVQLESFPDLNSHYFYLYRQTADGLFGRDIGGGDVPCAPIAMSMVSGPHKPRSGGDAISGITDPARRAAFTAEIRRQRDALELLRHTTVAAGLRDFTFLEYPLYTGKDWVAKEEGHFVRTIEGQDVLSMPAGIFAALRIRINSDFLGPLDQAHIWYGPRGVIRFRASFEGLATDDDGNIIGTVTSTSTEDLAELSLVGRP